MSANLIDLLRKIDDLIRIGTVTEVRSGECRVDTKGNHTNWRPYLVLRAGRTRRRSQPRKVGVATLHQHQRDHYGGGEWLTIS